MKSFCCAILFSLFLPCFSVALFADPVFTIAGVVHDVSGARISHAHILVHQADSNVVLKAETGVQGEFGIEASAAGNFSVEVVSEEFKPLTMQVVVSDQSPTIKLDITLEIAERSETIEVTADALAAETTSTQLGETLGTKKIENVPLNGRSFTDLLALQSPSEPPLGDIVGAAAAEAKPKVNVELAIPLFTALLAVAMACTVAVADT